MNMKHNYMWLQLLKKQLEIFDEDVTFLNQREMLPSVSKGGSFGNLFIDPTTSKISRFNVKDRMGNDIME